jgi:CRISPR/Cas system CSM-associated protein Csm3 (group 7 of RAMP superfamily)
MRTLNFNGKISTLEPLTVTVKNAVSTSGHRLPRNGGFNAAPYFPGTSIRGTLRHAAHKVIVDSVGLNADGKSPFDLAEHFMLAQGWISMVKPKPSRQVKSMLVLNYVAKTR